MKAKVTIDLTEYNQLLDDSKKFKEGFKSTYLKYEQYNSICGYTQHILSTNDDAVKDLMDQFERNKKLMEDSYNQMHEMKESIERYNKMSVFSRLFCNVDL